MRRHALAGKTPKVPVVPPVNGSASPHSLGLVTGYWISQVGRDGSVYLAREQLLERLAAIKVLRSELVLGEARDRFIRGARATAKLTRPHIAVMAVHGEGAIRALAHGRSFPACPDCRGGWEMCKYQIKL